MPEIVEISGSAAVSLPPPPSDRALDGALRFADREARFGEVPAAILTPALRGELERRRAVVAASFVAAKETRIAAVLAGLRHMPSRDTAELVDRESGIWQDIGDLAGLPAWALEEAAAWFRRGGSGSVFRPTCAELRIEAERRMRPHGEELGRIERVLRARIAPAPPPEDPERRRIAALNARRLAAEIAAGNRDADRGEPAPKRPSTPAEHAAHAEALRERFPVEAFALSDAALATMGRKRPKREAPDPYSGWEPTADLPTADCLP